MDRLIYTAMSGASQVMSRQAAVSHNLANISSTGYRAEEHRLRAVPLVSANGPATLPTRVFAVDASTHTDFSQGPMQYTGRNLDIAVAGSGWIALQLPDGSEAYTRAGSLELNVNGVLQTRSGIPVMGDGGPISIPPDSKIEIGQYGTVSVVPETGAQNTVNAIGRIKLVNPPTETLLRGVDGLFRTTDGVPPPVDDKVQVASGFQEGSNVNAVDQMVSMISLSRQFEMQMQMLVNAEKNDQAATQVIANL